MADARRFPRLELPFAIAGAAAGFLSAGLLANPRVNLLWRDQQPIAVIAAAIVASVTGHAIRRLCIRKKLTYELDDPDPLERGPRDRALIHGALIVLAGALVGAIVGAACGCPDGAAFGILSGAACALVFVPVGLAVVAAARSAQRARLGTLVAGSDRRAVWSILSTALAVTTLEALPDWQAAPSPPWPACAIAIIAGAVVLGTFAFDARASRVVEGTLAGLSAPPDTREVAPAIDLGLGDDVGAHVARGKVAYRDRDRVVDLVRGNPSLVRAAMSRTRLRALASFMIVTFVLALHALAAFVASVA